MPATIVEGTEIVARNRMRKAMTLADTLRDFHFSLEQVQQLPEHGWHIVAASAGTKPPSRETRELVVRIFEARSIGQETIQGKARFAQF